MMDHDKTPETKQPDEKQPEQENKPEAPDSKPLTAPEETESDKPFDFGGLPNRNLKKNLGCGG